MTSIRRVLLQQALELSYDERERLLLAIEGAASVGRRHQFFSWAQTVVQSLIPHDMLFCAYGDQSLRTFRIDSFASEQVPPETLAQMCHPSDGIMVKVISTWREIGAAPVLACPKMNGQSHYTRFQRDLERYKLTNLAAHGTPGAKESPDTYFCFCRVREPLSAKHAYMLEMLVPHLHVAFVRTLQHSVQDTSVRDLPFAEKLITEREVEVLHWVRDGKSNYEIAMILGISPLTVKNHLQKVFKKLKVKNRAQAIAKSVSLRIISSQAAR